MIIKEKENQIAALHFFYGIWLSAHSLYKHNFSNS